MTPSTFIIAIISFASSSKLESNVDKYSPYETPSGHLSLSLSSLPNSAIIKSLISSCFISPSTNPRFRATLGISPFSSLAKISKLSP